MVDVSIKILYYTLRIQICRENPGFPLPYFLGDGELCFGEGRGSNGMTGQPTPPATYPPPEIRLL